MTDFELKIYVIIDGFDSDLRIFTYTNVNFLRFGLTKDVATDEIVF